MLGKVLAVGPGSKDAPILPVALAEGNKVLLQSYAGFNAGDPTYPYAKDDDPILVNFSDILAVVED